MKKIVIFLILGLCNQLCAQTTQQPAPITKPLTIDVAVQRALKHRPDLEALQYIRFLTQQKRINLSGVKVVLEAISTAPRFQS